MTPPPPSRPASSPSPSSSPPAVRARRPVTVVTPVYNEKEVIRAFVDAVDRAMRETPYQYRLLLVDDGSEPECAAILDALCAQDPKRAVLHLSRNFGHQAALSAGLDHATGDAVIMMDSDMQHPPAMLPELLKLWEQGYDVVYTVRDDGAAQGPLKKLTSRLYYALMKMISERPVPRGAADFRLMSRGALDALKGLRERTRFLRGLTTWIGFRQVGVHYQPDKRLAGKSKYTLRKMIRLALDGITSMSTIPLRMILGAGMFISLFAGLYIAWIVIAYFVRGIPVIGWASAIVATLFLGGIQLTVTGVLGLYVAKIFDEVKGRPIYIVGRSVGLDKAGTAVDEVLLVNEHALAGKGTDDTVVTDLALALTREHGP